MASMPANPMFMVEFGPVTAHAFYGFVKQDFNELPATGAGETAGSISGRVVTLRTARPPIGTFVNGPPVPECYVALNDVASGVGVYAARCNEDSTFTITDVRPGTYQLVCLGPSSGQHHQLLHRRCRQWPGRGPG